MLLQAIIIYMQNKTATLIFIALTFFLQWFAIEQILTLIYNTNIILQNAQLSIILRHK